MLWCVQPRSTARRPLLLVRTITTCSVFLVPVTPSRMSSKVTPWREEEMCARGCRARRLVY